MYIVSMFPHLFPWVSFLPSFSSLLPSPSAAPPSSQTCCYLCCSSYVQQPGLSMKGEGRGMSSLKALCYIYYRLRKARLGQHCRDVMNCFSLCTGQICNRPLASVEDIWYVNFTSGFILLFGVIFYSDFPLIPTFLLEIP